MALARKPFVVIDAEILSSSVWSEAAHVKLVWLTLLILCDTEGYVGAAIPGIAHAAGVSLDQAREALALFMEPDPDSRTQKDEGRRLEVADRGFKILNFVEHLDRLSADRKRTRDRVRKFRERKRQMADGNVTVLPGNREQGIGTREEGRKELPALPPPPAERAEKATNDAINSLQLRLGALICQLSEHPNSRQMVPAWTREVTAYDRQDGTKVRGVSDFRTVRSIDRLERSVADAEWHLAELEKGVKVGT
jgi:hypothetical protein